MSLATRIIPTILCRGRQAVKGRGFDAWRPIGTVAEKVRVHAARGVDELVLLDITATREGRGPDLKLIEELSADLFAPLAVGGGVRTVEDVRNLLRAGADKVVIGTIAQHIGQHGEGRENRLQWVVTAMAEAVGCQAIVVSIDVKKGQVWTRSGTELADDNPAWNAKVMQDFGAGEILLQSIERDGTLTGYDLDLVRAVSSAVDVPVIASGGAGTYEHLHEAIKAGASAVAAGAMFQFTHATPRGAAQYLAGKGHEVRL